MAEAQKKAIGGFQAFLVTLKKSWSLFKRSKLGLAGTAIIAIFVFMGVFAPFVSPYTPEFLAPDVDVFVPVAYNKTYSSQSNFLDPVIGAGAPKDPTAPGGRLWLIVGTDNGTIVMNDLTKNTTPFSSSMRTLTINITSFGFSLPISNILYLVPGRNTFGRLEYYDDLSNNGLLGFAANARLILLDPFNRRKVLDKYIGFQPKWLVQDPSSAGELYDFPQWIRNATGGLHADRYIVAADDTHLVAYAVNYRSNQDGVPVPPGDIVNVISATMPVVGRPLPYFIQLQPDRSGIFVPTSNSRLSYFSMNGTYQYNMSLSLDGEPANITAPIGYIRSPEIQLLYVPLKSRTKAGIAYVVPQNVVTGNVAVYRTLLFNDSNVMVTAQPDPGSAFNVSSATPQFVLTHYENGSAVSSDLLRGSPEGTLDPVLNVHLPRPVTHFFYSPTNSQVFALDTDGTVWSAPTVSLSVLRAGLQNFFLNSKPDRKYLAFMGSWAGCRYSTVLSSEEMLGLTFEPRTGNAVAFKLLGASIAPLPPGKYPSGNTYTLGTDDQGHDILTQLIYGARVALIVGVFAALASVVIGTLVGLVAGFYGGFLDTILMRVTDIALVLPFLPLVLILAAIIGTSLYTVNIVVVIAVLGWPGIARVIRAQTLSLKERPFVDASRISGASKSRTMFVHIAPNVLPFSFLYMTLTVGAAILTEAAVSFLGLGDPRPSNVSWGIMLRTLGSSGNTLTAWWWLLPPGLCITLLSLGFYLVGRAVDEIVNPRLRER